LNNVGLKTLIFHVREEFLTELVLIFLKHRILFVY